MKSEKIRIFVESLKGKVKLSYVDMLNPICRYVSEGGPIMAIGYELYLVNGSYIVYTYSMGGAMAYEVTGDEVKTFQDLVKSDDD
jgi:hypothetical protein